jgi:hypothetical protein
MALGSRVLPVAGWTVLALALVGSGTVLSLLFGISVEHSVTDSTATYPEIISGVERNVDYDTHLLHLGVIAVAIAWTGAAVAWGLLRLATPNSRERQAHDDFSNTNST